jgi:hypothetical protein
MFIESSFDSSLCRSTRTDVEKSIMTSFFENKYIDAPNILGDNRREVSNQETGGGVRDRTTSNRPEQNVTSARWNREATVASESNTTRKRGSMYDLT